jgi:hypothetical protein
MHVTEKLTIFLGISVQGEHLLSSPLFCTTRHFREMEWDRRTLAILLYIYIYIYIYVYTHGETGIRAGMETTERKYFIL